MSRRPAAIARALRVAKQAAPGSPKHLAFVLKNQRKLIAIFDRALAVLEQKDETR